MGSSDEGLDGKEFLNSFNTKGWFGALNSAKKVSQKGLGKRELDKSCRGI